MHLHHRVFTLGAFGCDPGIQLRRVWGVGRQEVVAVRLEEGGVGPAATTGGGGLTVHFICVEREKRGFGGSKGKLVQAYRLNREI